MNPIDDSIPPFTQIPTRIQQPDTTISTTTTDITELACRLIRKLNDRSTALAQGAHYDLALRDAGYMRLLDPTCSIGYLKAGEIYEQQGRQLQALTMYEEGLVKVSSSDQHYTQLVHKRDDASRTAGKRMDFIGDLPVELASEIVNLVFDNYLLLPYTPCPYLYVSQKWRQRILNRNDLRFGLFRSRSPQTFHSSELAKFAAHIKSLAFEIGKSGPIHDENARDFINTHFPSLTHFQIEYFESNDEDLIFILEHIGRNLTHLYLYTEGWMHPPGIHLGRILDTCRNLEYVNLATTEVDLLTSQYPNITHFILAIYENDLPMSTIENLRAHLPSAVVFDVSPSPGSDGLSDDEIPAEMFIDLDEPSDEEVPEELDEETSDQEVSEAE